MHVKHLLVYVKLIRGALSVLSLESAFLFNLSFVLEVAKDYTVKIKCKKCKSCVSILCFFNMNV